MKKTCFVFMMFLLSASFLFAAMGDLITTYNFSPYRFVSHPNKPYLYASVPSEYSIAVINTNTLELEKMVTASGQPAGLAISIDGSLIYVAHSFGVDVIDSDSLIVVDTLVLPEVPRDLEVGQNNILYAMSSDSVMQVDASTGVPVGPAIGSWHMVYSGELEINREKTRLYYCDYGLSPASLYQFDVTNVSNPTQLWESPHGGLSGSNGQDLAISPDGQFISYACGAGQGGYKIAKYRTQDMAIVGYYNTGAYPRRVVYSPDGNVVYTVHTNRIIDVWDAYTFQSLGSITTNNGNYYASAMALDKHGQYLFASFSGIGTLKVFDTGRYITANHKPVADAGEDITSYAGDDGLAQVQLNGTRSYDPDGDPLEYFWFDKNGLIATGANPNVVLPLGEHMIELIVNDGTVDSEPNACIVTVVEGLVSQANIIPSFQMFPGSVYDNPYQFPSAMGMVQVVLLENEEFLFLVHVEGLVPNSLYSVFFDSDGIEPGIVSTAGPWAHRGEFWTDQNGRGKWNSSIPVDSVNPGVHIKSIFINRTDINRTVLISYNIEFETPNKPPVADAGGDQSIFAWIDGLADVSLVGTDSYDPDGDVLEYFWFDANELIASGGEPNVVLPVGEHVIELIVNDGMEDSEPNACVVTVIGPLETEARVLPRTLNLKSNRQHIIGYLKLSGSQPELDADQPMLLLAGEAGIEAMYQRLVYSRHERAWYLVGIFDGDAVTDNVPAGNNVPITLVSRFNTGQWIYGTDTIHVINPIPQKHQSGRNNDRSEWQAPSQSNKHAGNGKEKQETKPNQSKNPSAGRK